MTRRILKGVATSVLQTIVYYTIFFIGWTIGTMIHEPTPMTISEAVGFGLLLKFSIIAFGIMMLLMNAIDAFANSRKWTHGLLVSTAVIYLIYWSQDFNYIPLKTTLFLATGIMAIYSKIPIDNLLEKLFGRGSTTRLKSNEAK